MAWGANARNRSAEVRRVNYHEDGGSSRNRQSGNNRNNGGGDMSPLGKIIIGGICIYALGQVGLGWVTDTIGNIKDVLDFTDEVKTSSSSNTKASNNSTSKSKAKVKDKNVDIEIDISASDVADIIEEISNNLGNYGINASKASVVFVDYSVFEDSDEYQKHIIDKLDEYDNAVSFVAVCDEYVTEQEHLDRLFESASNIVKTNNQLNTDKFNDIRIQSIVNKPYYGNICMSVTFFNS